LVTHRHGDAPARDCVERSWIPDGEPRPCDVVPSGLSRRRLAPLRAGQPVGPRRARVRDGQHLHARRRARSVGWPAGPHPSPAAYGMTPLGHLHLLDLSRQLPGPFCSTLLADLGVDVVVVTAPNDPFATGIPFLARNKRSMTLNLKHDEGRAIF